MGEGLTPAMHTATKKAFASYLGGIEAALTTNPRFLVGTDITLADICFAAELVLFALSRTERERIEAAGCSVIFTDRLADTFPLAMAHFDILLAHPAFTPDLTPYHREMTLEKFLS